MRLTAAHRSSCRGPGGLAGDDLAHFIVEVVEVLDTGAIEGEYRGGGSAPTRRRISRDVAAAREAGSCGKRKHPPAAQVLGFPILNPLSYPYFRCPQTAPRLPRRGDR